MKLVTAQRSYSLTPSRKNPIELRGAYSFKYFRLLKFSLTFAHCMPKSLERIVVLSDVLVKSQRLEHQGVGGSQWDVNLLFVG